ncbi:MAG TPA: hypothetical protein VGV18_11330 [Verrucomicrobiae bacterium]|nr:hypothetical protein [Verrucomicrobiae bacterium]
MPNQPPNHHQPTKPPAEPLTEAERAKLTQEIREAQKLFKKLVERDRQQVRLESGAETIAPPLSTPSKKPHRKKP